MLGSLVKLDEKWGKKDVELSSFSPLVKVKILVRGILVSGYSSTTRGSISLIGSEVEAVGLVGSGATTIRITISTKPGIKSSL